MILVGMDAQAKKLCTYAYILYRHNVVFEQIFELSNVVKELGPFLFLTKMLRFKTIITIELIRYHQHGYAFNYLLLYVALHFIQNNFHLCHRKGDIQFFSPCS